MSVITDLSEGAAKGLFSGIGDMFKNIRNALGFLDPDKKAEIETMLIQLETQITTAQAEINKVEAASSDRFVSRWRPAIGWIGVAGLAWYFLISPILFFTFGLFGITPGVPQFDIGELMMLVLSMLGIGGMRSFDKYKGTSK